MKKEKNHSYVLKDKIFTNKKGGKMKKEKPHSRVSKDKNLIRSTKKTLAVEQKIIQDGLENVKIEDLLIPRYKLLQPLSKVITEEGFKGKAGQFMNTLTKECFDEFKFIPLHFSKYVIERDKEGKVAEIHQDNNLNKDKEMFNERWYYSLSEADQKKFTLVYSIVALKIEDDVDLNDVEEIVSPSKLFIMNFVKTNISKAKQILTIVKLLGRSTKNPKPYLCNFIFKDTSEKKTNDKGLWYVHKPSMYGFTPEAVVQRALSLISAIQQDNIKEAAHRDGQEYIEEVNSTDEMPF